MTLCTGQDIITNTNEAYNLVTQGGEVGGEEGEGEGGEGEEGEGGERRGAELERRLEAAYDVLSPPLLPSRQGRRVARATV